MTQRSRVARAVSAARVSVQLEGVRNFRDLGGYPTSDGRRVRPGIVFRSGHLVRATSLDVARLRGVGLRTIIDLRNDRDLTIDGKDADVPGTRTFHMPFTDPVRTGTVGNILTETDEAALQERFGGGKLRERVMGAYRDEFVGRTAELRRIFDVFLEDDTAPLVVHCSAGKDRAGWVSAVLLLSLGVDSDAVMADYLLSNDPSRMLLIRMPDGSLLTPDDLHPLVRPLFEARPEYLQAGLDAVEERFGGLSGYLREGIGLSAVEQDRLREKFLLDPLE